MLAKRIQCKCNPSQIARYHKRISGLLLDLIDIHLDIPAVDTQKLTADGIPTGESSKVIQERVQNARNIQTKRYKGTTITSNAELKSKDIKKILRTFIGVPNTAYSSS